LVERSLVALQSIVGGGGGAAILDAVRARALPGVQLSDGRLGGPCRRTLWLQQALDGEVNHVGQRPTAGPPATPALSGDIQVDVAIVGGGFTGLWTALELRERDPSARVALLEADICGAGASGRNGGFAMTWWSKFTTLAAMAGPEQARELATRSSRAVAQIGEFARQHGISDAFAPDGWLWAATNPGQVGAWAATNAAIAASGATPLRELDRAEAAALTGSPVHLGGVLDPTVAAVQPARLARALREAVLAAGVEIYEGTPVRSLAAGDAIPVTHPSHPGSGATTLHTPGGRVRAEQVVLATNAWSARIPELGRGLVVVASDIIATEPIPERLDALGLTSQVTISDSRRLVNYYRRTPDGRLLFGRGGGTLAFASRIGASFDDPGRRTAGVHSQLARIYPSLWDVPLSHTWSGPVDYSLSGLPFFVRLTALPGVLAAVGFSGDGVGPTRLAGEILAEMLLTGSDAGLPPGLRTVPHALMPPEPVRYLGGRMVRAATDRKERAEDLNLAPGRLARVLAAMDPTSGGHAE
jgi:glycine/D-amino acid oxidase-like deaminating enzyme